MASPLANGGWMSAGGRGKASDHFPDPWLDMGSLAMPETIQDALRWCEFLVMSNGVYMRAIDRVISYFLTDVEIVSPNGEDRIGQEEKQKYLDFLNDTIGIREVLRTVAIDYLVYGNSFTSLLIPFRRYLSCRGCGIEFPLKRVFNGPEFHFHWTGCEFKATCPHCKYNGSWTHIDRRSSDADQVKIKRWSPHEMDILHDPLTDDTGFVWKIPDDYRQLVKKGELFHLERASWEVVEAIKKNEALLFDKDVVYHMKEQALAGIKNRGWGISRVLSNFRQAWYVQVLHRFNEAIALDYVIPFRVLTPMARPGQGGEVNDPVMSINMGNFTQRVNQMLRMRRKDPARWNVLPFPLEYQALGGDATQLAPKDLLELGMDTLLNSIGVPVDLYKGSLGVQTAPAALRLFEANWSHLIHNLNRFLNVLVDKISQLMSWEPANARLQRVTHADDLNKQMAKLQLMMGGQLSRTTGLASVGVDFAEEERTKVEEEKTVAELTQQVQKDLEQQALMDEMAAPMPPAGAAPAGAPAPAGGEQGGATSMPTMQGMPGAMPGGGMPPVQPAGAMGQPMGPYGALQAFMAGQPILPNQPITMEEMTSIASTLAQQAMSLPEAQKDSFLIQLSKENPEIHALVKSQIEDMRRQAELQGRDMVMQQQMGKTAEDLTQDRLRALLVDSHASDWRQIDLHDAA